MPDQHFNVLFFSNLRDKVFKIWKIMGQICPLLSTRIRTLSPGLEENNALKCCFGIFPTTLIYIIMMENCQNNISMYGFSPIQGKRFKFVLKFYEARISECHISIQFIFNMAPTLVGPWSCGQPVGG